MLRAPAVWAGIFTLTVMIACGSNIRSKERVQEAIVERLKTRSGLDMNQLDVTATNVSFDRNTAHATVVFHPKNDSRVNSGMAMNYTLEDREGKWVVTGVGDSQGRGMFRSTDPSRRALPPGHPPVPGGPGESRPAR